MDPLMKVLGSINIKKPLVASEFVGHLARLDPVYREEEESLKVKLLGQGRCAGPWQPGESAFQMSGNTALISVPFPVWWFK